MMQQETFNRETWGRNVDRYASAGGFTDEGERVAYLRLADEMRNGAVLDLGVGGGRTIPLLRALTTDYVALDYMEPMVERCRARYPSVDVQEGDARDLSRCADERFDLVVFSHNGLDTLDREGRLRALAEVQRVLRPGGVFWMSTHNLDGPGPRSRPWHPVVPPLSDGVLHLSASLARFVGRAPGRIRNYLRARGCAVEGDGWSLSPLLAHEYGLVIHYTTLPRLHADLVDAGFDGDVSVLDHRTGEDVSEGGDLGGAFYFHVLARK